MSSYFSAIDAIRYQGPATDDALAFRHYDKDRLVLGRKMEEQLRFAACYWHSFSWNGFDLFGYDGTFDRPWHRSMDSMQAARLKADVAFEFFAKLGVRFYTFHDRDIAPEAKTARESQYRLQTIVEVLAAHQQRTGMRPLWGTANLFSHPRYMAGAATNPNPEIFVIAASQVKAAMDATLALNGENYVLWGGREGYETLLNTDVRRELDQLGRFLQLVVDYKHKIGFKGALLIEPKPREPAKHQYDFDTATVYGFLCRYGLEKEVKVNIEVNHATLSGHSFEHEVALAQALGLLGSIDMNRGDPLLGWDTDQFPNSVPDLAHAFYLLWKEGGLGSGGLNFDAKVRRQSIEAADLFHGHIGAMDVCARALLAAERLILDGKLDTFTRERYSGWDGDLGRKTLSGEYDLAVLATHADNMQHDPVVRSGGQERLENVINRFV